MAINRDPKRLLATFVRSVSQKNKTIETIEKTLSETKPYDDLTKVDEIPFSSERKYSACIFGDLTLIIGAPEVLLSQSSTVLRQVQKFTEEALRVVVFGYIDGRLKKNESNLAKLFKPLSMVVFEDPIRPEIEKILAELSKSNIEFKIISGDSPQTVVAIANKVIKNFKATAITGDELANLDKEAFAAAVLKNNVFSRIKPAQKQAIVRVLRSKKISTAMIGDGANDVLAIRESDLGIAMNAGSPMAKDVADIILLDNSFGVLPTILNESKRIVTNIQNIANIFLVKNISSILTILILGYLGLRFPFDPRHTELTGDLIVGVPSFMLAFDRHKTTISKEGFIPRLLLFSGIVGFVNAILQTVVYVYYDLADIGLNFPKTMLLVTVIFLGCNTVILIYMQYYSIAEIIRKKVIIFTFALILIQFVGAMLIPFAKSFFRIDQIGFRDLAISFFVSIIGLLVSYIILKNYNLIRVDLKQDENKAVPTLN